MILPPRHIVEPEILAGQVEIARRDELGLLVAVGSDGDDLRRAPPQAPPARHNPIL
jgi:hypothetical protein